MIYDQFQVAKVLLNDVARNSLAPKLIGLTNRKTDLLLIHVY